jgi:hypothetical protein
MARNFPSSPQSLYLQTPGAVFQGFQYAVDPRRDEYLSGLLRRVTDVAQQSTATVTYGGDGDVFGVVIDGLAITALALTDDDTSAAALVTAVQAYIDTYGVELIASVAAVANVVTVVFADGLPHTFTALDSGTTSSVVDAEAVASATYARLTYGLGVTLDTGAGFSVIGPNIRPIMGAASGTSSLLGVIAYDFYGQQSADAITAQGYDPAFLIPGPCYKVIKKGSVVVPWVGTLPTAAGSNIYWINDPATLADKNKFRGDANGGEADLVSGFIEGTIPELNLVRVKFDL